MASMSTTYSETNMFSAEESRVSHPAQANENLKVIRKFDVLFLLVGMDGMD